MKCIQILALYALLLLILLEPSVNAAVANINGTIADNNNNVNKSIANMTTTAAPVEKSADPLKLVSITLTPNDIQWPNDNFTDTIDSTINVAPSSAPPSPSPAPAPIKSMYEKTNAKLHKKDNPRLIARSLRILNMINEIAQTRYKEAAARLEAVKAEVREARQSEIVAALRVKIIEFELLLNEIARHAASEDVRMLLKQDIDELVQTTDELLEMSKQDVMTEFPDLDANLMLKVTQQQIDGI